MLRSPLSIHSRAECRIDLAAYRHNVALLVDRLTPGCELWAVVKADAYGHGVGRIASEAIVAGARRLCVATLSEAHHLRSLGIRVPILVMGPLDERAVSRAAQLDVAITVATREMVEALMAYDGPPVTVHVKVDTGMTRWGVAAGDAVSIITDLEQRSGAINVEGVMTHFATADSADDGGAFDRQLAAFEMIVHEARTIRPSIIAHAANSAATVRTKRAHFNAVRCGVATFGLDPAGRDAHALSLRPVMSLRSRVATVVTVAAGTAVGYGGTYRAAGTVRIAEVPIGYADGVRRALSEAGEVLIRGQRFPIAGMISMDHLAVEVDDSVVTGDVVTILGADPSSADAHVSAEEHARWSGSINYEVTCLVATEPRLTRTYVDG